MASDALSGNSASFANLSIPPSAQTERVSLSSATTVAVSLPNVVGAAIGSNLSIPITVPDLTGSGVRAYDLQSHFQPIGRATTGDTL